MLKFRKNVTKFLPQKQKFIDQTSLNEAPIKVTLKKKMARENFVILPSTLYAVLLPRCPVRSAWATASAPSWAGPQTPPCRKRPPSSGPWSKTREWFRIFPFFIVKAMFIFTRARSKNRKGDDIFSLTCFLGKSIKSLGTTKIVPPMSQQIPRRQVN